MRVGLTAAVAILLTAPASANVVSRSDTGLAVSHVSVVKAPPARVWAALLQPGKWWSSAHSWSGDAANMTLKAEPGGCFCETLPNGGFAEHARVIQAAPEKLLRLSGALGPMQGEAMAGTLTITLAPADGGTSVTFDYVAGGYARYPINSLPPAVDVVIGEQNERLKLYVETGKADLPAGK